MQELLISKQTLDEMMYNVTVRAACIIPRDVRKAIEEAERLEETEVAKGPLRSWLEDFKAGEKGNSICPDTGYQIYWVKVGDRIRIEGGMSSLYDAAKQAVVRATEQGYLRPHLVHPLTGQNLGTNVGFHTPTIHAQFDPAIDRIEIIAVCKGGGGEGPGSYQRNLYEGDGKRGVVKFVLDSFLHSSYSGKCCPPGIIGVGIGGTAETSTRLALEAAALRPVGRRHPDPAIAELEEDLLVQLNTLGIGPMGLGGKTSVLDVHIEYALTHFALLSVAYNTFCAVIRRATVRLEPSGRIEYSDSADWDYR